VTSTGGIGLAAVLGAAVGAASSFLNDVSSPYGTLGSRVMRAGWTRLMDVAEIASRLVGVGWAWAAAAVVAGWIAGGARRSAAAGAVCLAVATIAYYSLDSMLRDEPLTGYRAEIGYWCAVSLTVGPLLGLAGALVVRRGVASVRIRISRS
jgi:Family of unknown function (DUF6518)